MTGISERIEEGGISVSRVSVRLEFQNGTMSACLLCSICDGRGVWVIAVRAADPDMSCYGWPNSTQWNHKPSHTIKPENSSMELCHVMALYGYIATELLPLLPNSIPYTVFMCSNVAVYDVTMHWVTDQSGFECCETASLQYAYPSCD